MRIALIGLIIFSLFSVLTASVHAESLLVVDQKGEAIWNILAAESLQLAVPNRDFRLGYVAADATGGNTISIKKDGEKVSLTGTDGKSVDATGWKKNLVELVETPDTQKIEIAVNDGKFTIKQQDAVAETTLPIKIDPKERKLAIETPTGDKFLAILPLEALQSALRAKVLSRTFGSFEVVENENALSYKIAGEKLLNIFNEI